MKLFQIPDLSNSGSLLLKSLNSGSLLLKSLKPIALLLLLTFWSCNDDQTAQANRDALQQSGLSEALPEKLENYLVDHFVIKDQDVFRREGEGGAVWRQNSDGVDSTFLYNYLIVGSKSDTPERQKDVVFVQAALLFLAQQTPDFLSTLATKYRIDFHNDSTGNPENDTLYAAEMLVLLKYYGFDILDDIAPSMCILLEELGFQSKGEGSRGAYEKYLASVGGAYKDRNYPFPITVLTSVSMMVGSNMGELTDQGENQTPVGFSEADNFSSLLMDRLSENKSKVSPLFSLNRKIRNALSSSNGTLGATDITSIVYQMDKESHDWRFQVKDLLDAVDNSTLLFTGDFGGLDRGVMVFPYRDGFRIIVPGNIDLIRNVVEPGSYVKGPNATVE